MLMIEGAACFKKCENLTLHGFTMSGNLGAHYHAPQRSVLLNYMEGEEAQCHGSQTYKKSGYIDIRGGA